jgi:hypothetical protein
VYGEGDDDVAEEDDDMARAEAAAVAELRQE